MKTVFAVQTRLPAHMALLVCLLACGCAHTRLPMPTDMSLSGIDIGCLQDKIIVIDPGHGGPEFGAVGRRGITEAEVNLTVALHLWGLLNEAGAYPILTRTTDRALYAGYEFDLRHDLTRRAQAANQAGADLFVSIHHNAAVSRRVNSLIVFYTMGDPYRSRDAARSIGTALQYRLGRETHSIQAGNYTVLRSSHAPAILGEASFMTHPGNERALAYTRTLAAEARGYFDGILEYFSRGTPRVDAMHVPETSAGDARPVISARLDSGHERARIDTASVVATINGRPTGFRLGDGNTVEIECPELANARHRACIVFRNTLGNSSAQRCMDFKVDLFPHRIELSPRLKVIPPDPAAATAVDMLVLDRLGRPVADGTPVTFSTSAGALVQAESSTRAGRARAIVAAGEHAGTATLSAAAGNISAAEQIRFAVPDGALLAVSVRDTRGRNVYGAALRSDSKKLDSADRYGSIYTETDPGYRGFLISRQGYYPYAFMLDPEPGSLTNKNVVLQPVDDAVFFNRTIMLDPKGVCPSALPILELLKAAIEYAGGRAIITWRSTPAPSYRERVLRAAAEQADVFICIGARTRRCRAGHYHRSLAGEDLARGVKNAFADHGLRSRRRCVVQESTHYAIIQTSMPALELELPRRLVRTQPDAVVQALYTALRRWLQDHRPQTP